MKEQISALVDGELSETETARLLKAIKNDPGLREAWGEYHRVGDALRKMPQLSAGFETRLAQRLSQEPTILAPQRERNKVETPRRFPLSIAASVAAVSLVAMLGLQLTRLNQPLAPAQVASGPATQPLVADASPVTPAPAKPAAANVAHVKTHHTTPSNYLLAHQEFAPSYAPAYVRVVAEQMDGNP